MLKMVGKLPHFYVSRQFDTNVPTPISLTLGLSYKCNARCATCRVYDRSIDNELSIKEWEKIYHSIGSGVYWVTYTGGETFLNKDIVENYYHLIENCRPAIVNIPTNGLLHDKILESVWQMLKISPKTHLIINFSLDHCIPELNDEIRGVKGYYNKTVETIQDLQQRKEPNLTVGIHTVISKYNVKDIGIIASRLSSMLKQPDHYITEIAELRNELETVGLDIMPKHEDYRKAVQVLNNMVVAKSVIHSFRRDYYRKVLEWFDGKHIPCYAGYSSCQITPIGDVVPCCVKYDSMGNLREFSYDFKNLWHGLQAAIIREEVKECRGCPLANANYTSSLQHVPTMINVIKGLVL